MEDRQSVIARHRWLLLTPLLAGSGAVAALMALPLLYPATPAPDIREVHERAKNGDWEYATEQARRYVLLHPEDPAGHFVLGQAHLYGPQLQLTLATGVLETALRIHERTGSLGAWNNVLDPTEFVFRIYKIRAVVELRIVQEALQYDLAVTFVRRHLVAGLDQIRMGLQLKPDDPEAKEMEAVLKRLLDDLRNHPAPPPPDSSAEMRI